MTIAEKLRLIAEMERRNRERMRDGADGKDG